jgi:GNAT superfamily N-acetyltransferase
MEQMAASVTEVEIRRSTPDEAEVLTDLAHASKRYWGYPEPYIQLWKRDLTFTPAYIERNAVYTAVYDGAVVGVFAVTGGRIECELAHLWVTAEWIGRGLGRRLFDEALRVARATGAKTMRIVSDPNAEGFFRKMGARHVGSFPSKPDGRKLPYLVIDLAARKKSRG